MTIKKIDKSGMEVEMIADSISEHGHRISTFVLTYHRFIHGELMTARLFSRNAMSSRAVPVHKMIDYVNEHPATPVYWGKNQAGMQADGETNTPVKIDLSWLMDGLTYELSREEAWEEAKNFSTSVARGFADAGYHKQIPNRIIESHQMIRTVVTATEFDNWYWLRNHPDAQPEINLLAKMMLEVHNDSDPTTLHETEWHTPFYAKGVWSAHYTDDDGIDFDKYGVKLSDALKVSASCAAQASFRKADESIEKARNIYDKLIESVPVHASPVEHSAKPMKLNVYDKQGQKWEEGVTHCDRFGQLWSANFRGWVQYRQLIDGHTCWGYQPLLN